MVNAGVVQCAALSINSGMISQSVITNTQMNVNNATSGQFLKYDSTASTTNPVWANITFADISGSFNVSTNIADAGLSTNKLSIGWATASQVLKVISGYPYPVYWYLYYSDIGGWITNWSVFSSNTIDGSCVKDLWLNGIKIINNTITGWKFAWNLNMTDNQILCSYTGSWTYQLKLRYNYWGTGEFLITDWTSKIGVGVSDWKYAIICGGGENLTICQFRNNVYAAPMSYIAYNGTLQVSWDANLKCNVAPIEYENHIYKNVMDIRTKQFAYKCDTARQLNYGCIAQELIKNKD